MKVLQKLLIILNLHYKSNMKIVFVSNYMNHYQVTISDELYKLCDNQYYFIEVSEIPETRKNGGFATFDRPYILRMWKNNNDVNIAHKVCIEADVMICTSELYSLPFKKERLKLGKTTFEYSERLFKKGFINLFSKTNLINHFFYHTLFRNKPFYKLCAGAYVANDEYAMGAFKEKCFKFGYFPKVEQINIDNIINGKGSKIKILWCARFLKWKHPEMVVNLAHRLSQLPLKIEINMIGEGDLLQDVRKLAKKMKTEDVLHFIGNVTNEEVLNMMRSHHFFILTSDRQEGWGAVINEAMANGCCVVSSDAVGSVPYLIKDGLNGCLFRSGDNDSLYKCIKDLIDNKNIREQMTRMAYETITAVWSPECAARNLVTLFESMLSDTECFITEGPCSKALPYYRH